MIRRCNSHRLGLRALAAGLAILAGSLHGAAARADTGETVTVSVARSVSVVSDPQAPCGERVVANVSVTEEIASGCTVTVIENY